MSDRISSYRDFWPVYVRFHSHPVNRALHLLGSSAAIAALAAFARTGRVRYLAAAPVLGYGPAWVGHFFVEGNRPATFDHPLWSLRADVEMVFRMLTGSMDAEVERHTEPAPTGPASTDAASTDAVEPPPTTPIDVN